MIETTADPLSDLVNQIGDPDRRREAVCLLADRVGAENLILFIPDSELGRLTAAPGFPQTLPGGRRWRRFLDECRERGGGEARLPWPDRDSEREVLGVVSPGGTLMALIGGRPSEADLATIQARLPLLGWALVNEQKLSIQGAQADFARHLAQEATNLASCLDNARSSAEREIVARKRAEAKVSALNRTLEERVRIRTAALEEAVSQMEDFSYSVSHDLRAPARAIRGFAEILLGDCGEKIGDNGRDYLDRIRAAAERLDVLTSGVLSFARVARAEIKTEVVDLDALVKSTVQDCLNESPRSRVTICSPLMAVVGHPPMLSQSVTNLVDNAFKFVAPGVAPEVSIWTERGAERVRLLVEDNGIGIKEEHQAKIFNMFERLSREEPGTGMGLTMVRKAVERMGGQIGVFSLPGKGSTFWIDLPAAS